MKQLRSDFGFGEQHNSQLTKANKKHFMNIAATQPYPFNGDKFKAIHKTVHIKKPTSFAT